MSDKWRYEIQHGPEGEANFAWVYRGGEMVATMRTHHARDVVAALSQPAPVREAVEADKAEAEMREILAGNNREVAAVLASPCGDVLLSARSALRAMAAYGDLRARQERERCAKVAEGMHTTLSKDRIIGGDYSPPSDLLDAASAIRSLKDEPETGHG